ncbi:hypothetical protein DPSP01_014454 [Paraphaeosphaeria sporulosa]
MLILAISLAALHGLVAASPHGDDKIKRVGPDQSIQTAINAAKPGSSIFVKPGTYYEQLTITKAESLSSARTLSSFLPTRTPPTLAQVSPVTKPRTPQGALRRPPYQDVLIKTCTIKGFTGQNIAFVGGKNCRATKNVLVDGANYGFLTDGSENTVADNNVVTLEAAPLNFIAMCMDDQANPPVASNDISNYIIALCMIAASGLSSIQALWARGAKLVGNHITSLNQACTFGLASGIIVKGAQNTFVKENYVEGQKLNGKRAGIVVVDDAPSGSVASGNVVVMNVLRDNDVDIFFKYHGEWECVAEEHM